MFSHYMIENKDETYNLYSPRIGCYVMKDASFMQIQVALAEEIEYKAKLEIVKMCMYFPAPLFTIDGQKIVNKRGEERYEAWYKKLQQQIAFPERYYNLIDEKIRELFTEDEASI